MAVVLCVSGPTGFRSSGPQPAGRSRSWQSLAVAGLPRLLAWGTIMSIGTVKWFNPVKGYGFIEPDDGSNDVFVHKSAVACSAFASLSEGQRVSYDLERGPRGKMAAVRLRPA